MARALGWKVLSLARMGRGCPDLLLWRYPQGFRLIEVKVGPKAKLTPEQHAFREQGWPVLYVHGTEDAKVVLETITKVDLHGKGEA